MQVFGSQKQKGMKNGTQEGKLKTFKQHQTFPGHVIAVHGLATEVRQQSRQFRGKQGGKRQYTAVGIKEQGGARTKLAPQGKKIPET